MRHANFMPAALACALGLLLALASSMTSKPYIVARYKQSGQQGCFAGILPSDCTQSVTGVPCTSSFGTATRTWYQDDACTVPFYKVQ